MSFGEDLIGEIFSSPFDTISALSTLYGVYSGNRASNEANAEVSKLTQSEIERNNEIYGLYAEGGENLEDNISRLLKLYGDFGQVTPEGVDTTTLNFATERSKEEKANKGIIENLTDEDIERLKGYESAFRQFADTHLNTAKGTVYDRDAVGKNEAPDSMEFARLQDQLTAQFMNLRSGNTQRALDAQYAKATASIPAGMENSTLRVQMERQMADLGAQKRNEDLVAAIGDAQSYISGLQSAASNQQNLTNAERNMQRNLVSDALGYGTQTMANSLLGGNYGQGFATTVDAQYGRNIDETNALQGMRNNTALSDYLTGMSTVSAENVLANNYIGQVAGISTLPYDYTAKGVNTISNSNALDSLSTMASSAANISAGNMRAAGGWWDDIGKNAGF